MAKTKEKPGFYIWFKTVDQMAECSFEEKGRIYAAAEEFARYGILPTFEDRFLRSIWTRIQADLQEDDGNYKQKQRDNQIKGWKSDFKRNYAPKHGIDPEDEDAMNDYIQQRLTDVESGQQKSSNCNPISNSNSNPISNSNSSISNRAAVAVSPTRHKYGEYSNVLLTDEDLKKLKAEFPGDWERRINRLSEYIASTGKTYKNHLATIRAWAKKDKEEGVKQDAKRNAVSDEWGDEKPDCFKTIFERPFIRSRRD